MPNWCGNRLTITGPEQAVSDLMGRVVVDNPDPARGRYDPPMVLDYAAVVPEPAHDPAVGDGWYEWRRQHWGVKWNHPGLYTLEVELDGPTGELRLEFDTPWGPPLPFLNALAAAFPGLTYALAYEEQGNELYGVWTHRPEEED
jgi:hypothetical protein